MPITWQVFHDFGMMIVVLVQRNKLIQLTHKVIKIHKYQINVCAKKWHTIGVLEEIKNLLSKFIEV